MGLKSSDEFQNLVAKRAKWVQSSKENNFDFDGILAGLYNDPSHFIYEILQNAEDADAKEISFDLYENRLEIFHDGKEFDFKDIDGVTGIGISTKKDDLNAIGKFGVGFKSVFAITETPIINSGQYHIKIDDFVVPSITISNGTIDKTKITLPFNHSKRFKDEVFELVENKLENIRLVTLLFLSNIDEIRWQTPTKSGHYYKTSERLSNFENIERVSVISVKESREFFEEYLVLNRPIELEASDLRIEIAYRIGKDDSDNEVITPVKDAKLVVFFPTEKVTYLNFLIQGPYKTTPNRENIPLDDEQNKQIIEETGNLVAESISIIKGLGLLDISFLEVLPIVGEHMDDSIYEPIYEKVKQKLLSDENLLPTNDGKYTSAQKSILARGKELTEFLSTQDIGILFGKQHWLCTEITFDRTRHLRDYLVNELEIKEVDFEDFANQISSEFLETKDDLSLIDFYSRLLEQRALCGEGTYGRSQGVLRRRPIIRLLNNEHVEPFDANGNVQVYLPTEAKSEYKTVKPNLTNNENSLEFLKELGLTTPDIFAELNEFILPKYKQDEITVEKDEYLADFEKILIAYERVSPEKKKQLMSDLSELHLIQSCRSKDDIDKSTFLKPSEVYIKTPDLEQYFEGFDSVYFASSELFERFDKAQVESLLLEIGCENKPRRIQVNADVTSTDKSKLRKRRYNSGMTYEIHTIDYDYEGLDNFLTAISKPKSCLLWDLLLKNLASCEHWNKADFFQGEYKWKYYSEYTETFDSKVLRTLKKCAWLVDKNGELKPPSDITPSDLADGYNQQDDNKDILANVLGLQLDEIKVIEQKTGGKFIPKEEVSEYEQWKAEKAQEDLSKWQPEVEPDEVETNISEVELEIVDTPDLSYQESHSKLSEDDHHDNETDSNISTSATSSQDFKNVGNWGEAYVYKTLRDRFANETFLEETELGFKVQSSDGKLIEIKWLNKEKDIGKGYDLVINSDVIEIEYIEVKSKKGSEKELIQITGTQWDFARHLFDKGDGEKYQIYVVNNAGSQNASIMKLKNPIRLWKDGKLYAHPINFKI